VPRVVRHQRLHEGLARRHQRRTRPPSRLAAFAENEQGSAGLFVQGSDAINLGWPFYLLKEFVVF
jgi:hypothetical protein